MRERGIVTLAEDSEPPLAIPRMGMAQPHGQGSRQRYWNPRPLPVIAVRVQGGPDRLGAIQTHLGLLCSVLAELALREFHPVS